MECLKKIESRLVADWRQAHKWLTVQAAVVIAVLAEAQEQLPMVREFLPEGWVKWAALAVVVARLIQQGGAAKNGR